MPPPDLAKQRQTRLAEASVEAALFITKRALEKRYAIRLDEFPFAVLGLGKLGGGGMDYGSDLDLVLIYDDAAGDTVIVRHEDTGKKNQIKPGTAVSLSPGVSASVFYSRAVEIFVNALSSLTRDGLLYRVDLRLRPDGKNGATSISRAAFLNYLETRAAMWEWLAYVKLRGVAGDLRLAEETENEARKILHENARQLKARDAKLSELQKEAGRIRERLEAEKSAGGKGKEIDIKFGAGGMLDVYFAVRFLQLRDDVPDDATNRSTAFILEKLYANKSLTEEDFVNFSAGYEFLTELDHHLRLTVGRSSRLPVANQTALQIVAERMKIVAVQNLLEQLTAHRLNIRASFENVIGD